MGRTIEAERRVLFVDDDRDMRELGRESLEEAGFRTTVGASLEDAVQKLESDRFDAIVTDLMMNGSPAEGLDLCRLCHERWPQMRVFAVSGDEQACAQAKLLGVAKVWVKPFDLHELCNSLR